MTMTYSNSNNHTGSARGIFCDYTSSPINRTTSLHIDDSGSEVVLNHDDCTSSEETILGSIKSMFSASDTSLARYFFSGSSNAREDGINDYQYSYDGMVSLIYISRDCI